MFIEILVATLLGIFSGIFTGLTPGVHINLVSVLMITFSSVILAIASPVALCSYLIGLAITHTFLDALPSIYLGAPDEAQALNVLPGHRLLFRGEGHNALLCTVIGALGALILGAIFFLAFVFGIGKMYPYLKGVMGYILTLIMIFMIKKEKKKWLKSLVCFLISGCLGLIVFSIPNLNQPLLPLLSGMFGFSLLLVSLAQKSKIPEQKTNQPLNLNNKNMSKAVSGATLMGFIAAFLPGFGSSQAAIIATSFIKNIGDEGFIILVSGINTANMLISIGAAYAIQKARSGAIVTVNYLLGEMTFNQMILFVGASLFAGGIAAIITIKLSKVFAKYIVKVNYNYLIIGILIFVSLMTIYFDGFIGGIILLTSTSIGLIASNWEIGKNHLMGCLIIPVILYFIL
jgi:putative membrane protein